MPFDLSVISEDKKSTGFDLSVLDIKPSMVAKDGKPTGEALAFQSSQKPLQFASRQFEKGIGAPFIQLGSSVDGPKSFDLPSEPSTLDYLKTAGKNIPSSAYHNFQGFVDFPLQLAGIAMEGNAVVDLRGAKAGQPHPYGRAGALSDFAESMGEGLLRVSKNVLLTAGDVLWSKADRKKMGFGQFEGRIAQAKAELARDPLAPIVVAWIGRHGVKALKEMKPRALQKAVQKELADMTPEGMIEIKTAQDAVNEIRRMAGDEGKNFEQIGDAIVRNASDIAGEAISRTIEKSEAVPAPMPKIPKKPSLHERLSAETSVEGIPITRRGGIPVREAPVAPPERITTEAPTVGMAKQGKAVEAPLETRTVTPAGDYVVISKGVKRPKAPPAPKGKAPAMMIPDEYVEIIAAAQKESKQPVAIKMQDDSIKHTTYEQALSDGLITKASFNKGRWGGLSEKQHDRMIRNAAKESHKYFVKKNLIAGKPVYKGWQKDYPDLAKKYGGEEGYRTTPSVRAAKISEEAWAKGVKAIEELGSGSEAVSTPKPSKKALRQADKILGVEKSSMPSAVSKYIRRIRNVEKKRYAKVYTDWKLKGEQGPKPETTLGGMGEQAVRLEIDSFLRDINAGKIPKTGTQIPKAGPLKVRDKSVRDHSQEAILKGDIIQINSYVGRQKAGSFTIKRSEWPKNSFDRMEFLRRKNPYYDTTVAVSDRIIDAQQNAIDKLLGTTSSSISTPTTLRELGKPTKTGLGEKGAAEGGTTLYSGVPISLESIKEGMRGLRKTTFGQLKHTPEKIQDIMRARHVNIRRAEYDAPLIKNLYEKATKELPPEVRLNMDHYYEQSDVPSGAKYRKLLTPDQRSLVKSMQSIGDELTNYILANEKYLDKGFVDKVKATRKSGLHYLYHKWTNPKTGLPYQADPWGGFTTDAPHFRKRKHNTLESGIKSAKLEPATLNIGEMISDSRRNITRAVETRKMIDDAANLDVPELKVTGDAKVGTTGLRFIEGRNAEYHPSYTKFHHNAFKKFRGKNNPSGDVWIHESVLPAFRSYIASPKYGNLMKLLFAMKTTLLDFSLFHVKALGLQELAAGRVPFAGIPKGKNLIANRDPVLGGIVAEGLQLHGVEDVPMRGLDFALPVGGRHIPSKIITATRDFTFGTVHTNMKASFAVSEFYRRLPDYTRRGLPRKQLAKDVGQYTNDLFGGQDYKGLLIKSNRLMQNTFFNPQFRKVLQGAFISPDWFYSHVRMATKIGRSVAEVPIPDHILKKIGIQTTPINKSYLRYAEGAIGIYGLANIYNYQMTKHMDGEGRYMWQNDPGREWSIRGWWDDETGRKGYFRPMKSFAEVPEFIRDPHKKALQKLMPIWPAVVESSLGVDLFRMEKVDRGVLGALGHIAHKGATPIPVRGAIDVAQGKEPIQALPFSLGGMPVSKGTSAWSAGQMLWKAYEENDNEKISDVWRLISENNLDLRIVEYAKNEAKRAAKK